MGLETYIKGIVGSLSEGIWPLKVHEPSDKAVKINDANVVLILKYSTKEELTAIIAFIEEARKVIDFKIAIAFSLENKIETSEVNDALLIVNMNDFNLLGKFKKRFSGWLKNNEFDILISFVDESDLFSNKIISNISARFKTGSYNLENVSLYDLTINHKSQDLKKKLELSIHYINELNINL